jgi:hypothetical protein
MRFKIYSYDYLLSDTSPAELREVPSFKEAIERAIDIMKIDLSADAVMIWDEEKELYRARLIWNEDVEARGVRDEKKVFAVGEDAVLSYYLRRSR